MDISSQSKLAKNIFRLLKVNEIIFPIGKTPKGNLGIRFADSLEGFEIILDSVPLSTKDMLADDNNIELKRIIEKYWFDSIKEYSAWGERTIITTPGLEVSEGEPLKKKGRPKGSKNKVKATGNSNGTAPTT